MRKTLLLFFALLTVCVSGAWAAYGPTAVQTLTVTSANGTFAQGNSNWNRLYTSTATSPKLTISTTTNGSNGNIFKPISNATYALDIRNGFKYQISVSEDYIITGYRVTATAQSVANTITIGEKVTNFAVGVENYVEVSDINASSVPVEKQFQVGQNKDFYANIEVYVKWNPITAASQFSNSKVYTVTNNRGSGASWMVVNNGTSLTVNNPSYAYLKTDGKQQFAFITSSKSGSEQIYLYNVGAGKFLKKNNTLSVTDGDPLTFVSSSYENGSGVAYPIFMKFDDDHVINLNSTGTGVAIDTWGGSWEGSAIDEGNSFAILPAGDYDLTQAIKNLEKGTYVTYEVYYNGSLVDTEEDALAHVDDAPSLSSAKQHGYCTYTYYSDPEMTEELDAIESTTETVYVVAEWDGPFDISDVGSDDMHWYYWKFLNVDTYCYNNSGALAANATKHTDDTGKWAFIGDPYNGIQIINKGAKDGSDNYLVLSSIGNGTIGLHGASDATYTIKTYFPKAATHSSKGAGIAFYAGSYNASNVINQSTGYWSLDNGGVMVVEEVPADYSSNIVSEFASFFVPANVGKYFALTSEGYEELSDDYETYSEACTASEYNTFKADVASYLNLPATGNYLLYNDSKERYLGQESNLAGFTTSNTAATIVKLTNNGDGTFGIQVQGGYIKFPGSSGAGQQLTTITSTTQFTYDIETAGKVKFTYMQAAPWPALTLAMNSSYAIVNQPKSDTTTEWVVTDAPSTINLTLTPAYDKDGNQNTYATLCVPFNITGLTRADSKTVKAYTPTIDGDYAVPGEGATTITAGTPVILIGSDEEATSVTATIGSSYVTSPVAPTSSSVLTGTFADTSIDCTADTGTNYVLGFDPENSNRIGFYHVDNESFGLKANRAYLYIAKGGSVKGFTFGFDRADGIKAMENTSIAHDRPIFNLAGQRMSKMQKGINIVNGKKVVVK